MNNYQIQKEIQDYRDVTFYSVHTSKE